MYSDDYESAFDGYGFGDYDYEKDELEQEEWETEFDDYLEDDDAAEWSCDDPNCEWCK